MYYIAKQWRSQVRAMGEALALLPKYLAASHTFNIFNASKLRPSSNYSDMDKCYKFSSFWQSEQRSTSSGQRPTDRRVGYGCCRKLDVLVISSLEVRVYQGIANNDPANPLHATSTVSVRKLVSRVHSMIHTHWTTSSDNCLINIHEHS